MSVTTELNGITAKCRIWSWIYFLYFLQYVQFPLFLFCFILISQRTIAAPNSHKGSPKLDQSNYIFIVSLCPYLTLFSHEKIKRYGRDLQLSFRLAIVERISGKPAPEILHHPLTQSLSYNWVNELH